MCTCVCVRVCVYVYMCVCACVCVCVCGVSSDRRGLTLNTLLTLTPLFCCCCLQLRPQDGAQYRGGARGYQVRIPPHHNLVARDGLLRFPSKGGQDLMVGMCTDCKPRVDPKTRRARLPRHTSSSEIDCACWCVRVCGAWRLGLGSHALFC